MRAGSRVDAGVDADDDASEVDERERVEGGLDGGEIPKFGVLIDGYGARREGLVEGALDRAVPEPAHEPDPSREPLLDQLGSGRVRRKRVRIRVRVGTRSEVLRVGEDMDGAREEEEEGDGEVGEPKHGDGEVEIER